MKKITADEFSWCLIAVIIMIFIVSVIGNGLGAQIMFSTDIDGTLVTHKQHVYAADTITVNGITIISEEGVSYDFEGYIDGKRVYITNESISIGGSLLGIGIGTGTFDVYEGDGYSDYKETEEAELLEDLLGWGNLDTVERIRFDGDNIDWLDSLTIGEIFHQDCRSFGAPPPKHLLDIRCGDCIYIELSSHPPQPDTIFCKKHKVKR